MIASGTQVLLSESTRPMFTGFEPRGEGVAWSPNLVKSLSDLLRHRSDSPLSVLVVGCPLELVNVQSIFQQARDLAVAWAVYTPQPLDPREALSLQPLLDLRIGKVLPDEWSFLLLRFQQHLEELGRRRQDQVIALKIHDQIMDQEALIRIGKSLASERDQDRLLRTILFLSKKITGADAGSIFLVEEKDGIKQLRFKYSHTFSKDLEYEEYTLPLDSSSIAGYVALTGKTLNIPDVYALGPDDPVTFNRAFDEQHGYRTRSMLVTPMTDHQGRPIGVIQLINSKEKIDPDRPLTGNEAFEIKLETPQDFEERVVPFQKHYEDFMQAVAGQAAIAIENNRMIRQIERQFEEFIKAAVYAIESRDPATSGHSIRVAKLCVAIAQAINQETEGPFAKVSLTPVQMKELYYAALLHDFGKVYIDLSLFMKAKKLTPQQLEILKYRIALIYRSLELEHLRYERDRLLRGESPSLEPVTGLEKLKELWRQIDELIEPNVVHQDLDGEINQLLEWISDIQVRDLEGRLIPVLTPEEIKNLKIARGSLNDEERAVIQSHVLHTYNFVKKIPWPPEYAGIPEIAVKHHEMLDGSGYPFHLKGEEIPLQARIMAVSDVFDALAASDRPYKKAIPLDKVLSILQDEAKKGKLDKDIVGLFIRNRLYLHHQRFQEAQEGNATLLEVLLP